LNLFDLPGSPIPEELTTILAEGANTRIERIVSDGQVSGWYDQDEAEFVALLDGAAEIEYENGDILAMGKGDTLTIPPGVRHRVSYTSSNPPCVWLCVFYS